MLHYCLSLYFAIENSDALILVQVTLPFFLEACILKCAVKDFEPELTLLGQFSQIYNQSFQYMGLGVSS